MIAPISEARPKEQSLCALSLASARAYPAFVAELRRRPGAIPAISAAARWPRPAIATRPRRSSASSRCASGSACRCGGCARARRVAWSRGWRPRVRLALDVPDDHVIEPHALTACSGRGAAACGRRVARAVRGRRGVCVGRPGRRGSAGVGGAVCADQVVIAAGVWSSSLDGIPDGRARAAAAGQGPDAAPARPERPRPADARAADEPRLRRPARRRPLRSRSDDGGARLRHDDHRRGDVRAAARRDRAGARDRRMGDRRAGRPGCARAPRTTRPCSARAPSRDCNGRRATTVTGSCSRPITARCARGHAGRRGACPRSPRRSMPSRFAGVAVGA